ncbi:cytochrome b/b6 domain-containing protein [Agromyces aerolatus]|uniref:cytochrome b/b6 domain-containing protein n=1 Tax=Agromyces sp. LY-1074 TaxID=3074080 RepID=UPI002858F262|nr:MULTISPECIES: cytochrome b/b6 domain-containing protein [unclassified Agromyces]MDR5700016.1 cytochrome b/b6 domain-containing protein [Agromyces sp. LY-1074]MDR5706172.1 cytochrome b/b6 domain-containing protein [Agromyces sp. LY-1358]
MPPDSRSLFAGLSWKRFALWAGGALILLVLVVAAARGLRALPAVQSFVETYPGHRELPAGAPVGIPAWLGWQHFLNVFFLVMLVRTGLIIRAKQRPPAFWTRDNSRFPRTKGTPRRLGISVWLHLVVDALWVLNGVIYVVLLFATGQWLRIVPTDWQVVPNAISVVLQYASLDWPAEHAWLYYNDAQVLSYFAIVFLVSPIAIVTGLRLSPVWPREGRWTSLPSERTARVLHFPTMLVFLLFTFVHVVLVLTTGALRNLNHMYASRDADDWIGFAVFAVSVVVLVAGWLLARPLVLAPLAERFGSLRRMPPPPPRRDTPRN